MIHPEGSSPQRRDTRGRIPLGVKGLPVDQFGGVPAPSRKRFASTDHLSAQAVSAFIDNGLPKSAHVRALDHLVECEECRDAIEAERDLREKFQSPETTVTAPQRLLGSLSAIPDLLGKGCESMDPPEPKVAPEAGGGRVKGLRFLRLRRR